MHVNLLLETPKFLLKPISEAFITHNRGTLHFLKSCYCKHNNIRGRSEGKKCPPCCSNNRELFTCTEWWGDKQVKYDETEKRCFGKSRHTKTKIYCTVTAPVPSWPWQAQRNSYKLRHVIIIPRSNYNSASWTASPEKTGIVIALWTGVCNIH